MARPQYPSDEKRRKTKPHAKVHLRARDHKKTARVFSDPTMRGVAVGLWMLGVEKFAGKTAGEVILTRGDMTWISGRSHRHYSEKCVRTVCKLLDYPMTTDGELTYITIRNLAQKQGFDSADRGETPPDSADSASLRTPSTNTELRTPTPSEEKRARALRSVDSAESMEPDPRPFSEQHPKLVHLLGSSTGDPAEKLAWLDDEGPVIEADVAAGKGTWAQITTRYYRRYLRGDREHRDAAQKQRLAVAVRAAEEADRAAEEAAHAAEHAT